MPTIHITINEPARRKTAKNSKAARSNAGRSHLTGSEVGKLIAAPRGIRNEARDLCRLLLMFRHGLCISEACRLRLDQVDAQSRVVHIV